MKNRAPADMTHADAGLPYRAGDGRGGRTGWKERELARARQEKGPEVRWGGRVHARAESGLAGAELTYTKRLA